MPVAAAKRLAIGLAEALSALRYAHSWRWLTYGIALILALALAAVEARRRAAAQETQA